MINLDYDGQLIKFINHYGVGARMRPGNTVDGCKLFWNMISAFAACFIIMFTILVATLTLILAFIGWVQCINYLVLGYHQPWMAGLSIQQLGVLYGLGISATLVTTAAFIKLFIIDKFLPKLSSLSFFYTPKVVKDIGAVTKGAYNGAKENFCPYIKIK